MDLWWLKVHQNNVFSSLNVAIMFTQLPANTENVSQYAQHALWRWHMHEHGMNDGQWDGHYH